MPSSRYFISHTTVKPNKFQFSSKTITVPVYIIDNEVMVDVAAVCVHAVMYVHVLA